jgi:hypothetical protein
MIEFFTGMPTDTKIFLTVAATLIVLMWLKSLV